MLTYNPGNNHMRLSIDFDLRNSFHWLAINSWFMGLIVIIGDYKLLQSPKIFPLFCWCGGVAIPTWQASSPIPNFIYSHKRKEFIYLITH